MSRQDTFYIKAFAMLLILFHNYSHIIQPWAGENEFEFSSQYASSFLMLLKSNPLDIVRLVFAFFGHYGVQLFIFISGYGLFLSYRDKQITWWKFMEKHLLKLYPVYILAVLVYFLIFPVQFHRLPFPWEIKFAIYDLLFIQNFMPHLVYKMVGPWWFFSLIVQLYIIFPFILALFKRYGIKAIISIGLIAWVTTLIVNPIVGKWDYNLYYFFVSRLPVFCLGILFAWLADFKLPWWLIGLSGALVLAGNLTDLIWPFSMLAVAIVLLVAVRLLIPAIKKSNRLSGFLSWVGVNSLFIFAVHGFLRWPFTDKAEEIGHPLYTIVLGLAFLALSLLVAWIIKKVENGIQARLIKPYFIDGKRPFLIGPKRVIPNKEWRK